MPQSRAPSIPEDRRDHEENAWKIEWPREYRNRSESERRADLSGILDRHGLDANGFPQRLPSIHLRRLAYSQSLRSQNSASRENSPPSYDRNRPLPEVPQGEGRQAPPIPGPLPRSMSSAASGRVSIWSNMSRRYARPLSFADSIWVKSPEDIVIKFEWQEGDGIGSEGGFLDPPHHIFSRVQKKRLVYLVSMAAMFSPLSSNIYFPAVDTIAKVSW